MDLTNVLEFEKFVNSEVKQAAAELNGLAEGSRTHLQKLVYTNLVDRFDVMVDKTILDNSLHPTLLDESLKKLDSPVTESEVLRLLLDGSDIRNVVQSRVKNILSNGVLRERHSKKLSKLFSLFEGVGEVWNKPRVNNANGNILTTYTVQNKKVPASICGYADWLYSRRNSIVHGGGSNTILSNDVEQLKKIFKVDVAKTTRLKLGAITTASTYYLAVVHLIKSNNA